MLITRNANIFFAERRKVVGDGNVLLFNEMWGLVGHGDIGSCQLPLRSASGGAGLVGIEQAVFQALRGGFKWCTWREQGAEKYEKNVMLFGLRKRSGFTVPDKFVY